MGNHPILARAALVYSGYRTTWPRLPNLSSMSPFDSSPHARISTLLVVLGSLTLLHAKNLLPAGSKDGFESAGLTVDSGAAPSSYLNASALTPSAFLDDGDAMIDTLAGAPGAVTGMDRFQPIPGGASSDDMASALSPAGVAKHDVGAFAPGNVSGGSGYAPREIASGGGGSGWSSPGSAANGGFGRQAHGNSAGGSTAGAGGDHSGQGASSSSGVMGGGLNTSGYGVSSAKLGSDESDSTAAVAMNSAFDGDPLAVEELGERSGLGLGLLPGASDLLVGSAQIAAPAAYLAAAIDSESANRVSASAVAKVSETTGTLGLAMLGLGLVVIFGRRTLERPASRR